MKKEKKDKAKSAPENASPVCFANSDELREEYKDTAVPESKPEEKMKKVKDQSGQPDPTDGHQQER